MNDPPDDGGEGQRRGIVFGPNREIFRDVKEKPSVPDLLQWEIDLRFARRSTPASVECF